MSEEKTTTKLSRSVRENGQYILVIGIIASLLVVAQIPIFVVFFFGVFIYFIVKMFATGHRSKTRTIFEFYLTSHEILRNEDRHWYGFELNEAIQQGEQIIRDMRQAPALVHFCLGALYLKVNDLSSAEKHLARVSEDPDKFESSVVYPSSELRNYVTVLRKIERDPKEAPLTAAAIRSLERSRALNADKMLKECREFLDRTKPHGQLVSNGNASLKKPDSESVPEWKKKKDTAGESNEMTMTAKEPHRPIDRPVSDNETQMDPARMPITEVLHDIYDRNIQ